VCELVGDVEEGGREGEVVRRQRKGKEREEGTGAFKVQRAKIRTVAHRKKHQKKV